MGTDKVSGGNKRGERGSRTTAVGRNPTTNQPPNQETISPEHLNCHCKRVVVHNPLRIPRICVISCIGLFSECRLLGSGPHALEERAMPPTDLEGSPPGARRGGATDDSSSCFNRPLYYGVPPPGLYSFVATPPNCARFSAGNPRNAAPPAWGFAAGLYLGFT